MKKKIMRGDVILVLGSGILNDGSLPPRAKERVVKAVDLYKKGLANKLLMSGRHTFKLLEKPKTTEAKSMQEFAKSLGVAEEDIFIEENSMDTVGNAYFSKLFYLDPNRWKKIIVVTSDFHVKRSKFLFEKVLGQKYSLCFFGAAGVSEAELKERKLTEELKIESMKEKLKNIKKGDDVAVAKWLYELPWYKNYDQCYNNEPQVTGTNSEVKICSSS